MVIEYVVINDTQKLLAADIVSKMESIDKLLADIQTERATAEALWRDRDTELRNEKMKLNMEMRAIRAATVTKAK